MCVETTVRILIKFKIHHQFPNIFVSLIFLVSEDSNVRKLSSKYGVEIAISADTMRMLAGSTSPFFKQAWDIPFVVQEVNINGIFKHIFN